MSTRRYGYDKGSSRSTRDDSRSHERDEWNDYNRRSRSRSPRRKQTPNNSNQYSPDRSRKRDSHTDSLKDQHTTPNEWESDEDLPSAPPPPRISKVSIGFNKPKPLIKMNLGGASKSPALPTPKASVASIFNTDDDDEPEEMPAEARMRMRNIGRETPTSAGPNSFGKTKQGFCDSKKVFEKNLKQALDTADKNTKFPQTIYKLKN